MMNKIQDQQIYNLQQQITALEEEIGHLFSERKHLMEENRTLLATMLEQKEQNPTQTGYETPLDLILNQIKELPQQAKVACQGVAGSFSHQAADQFFTQPEICFFPQFEDVFQAVEKGSVEYGVLPIENSTAGSVVAVYDLMRRHNFYIVQETGVPVQHCLLGCAGTTLDSIAEVYSHPQALSQCQEFFQSHPQYDSNEFSNTAAAAQYIAKQKDTTIASISSRKCAELYQLSIIASDIQDILHNTTRFICISKTPGFSRKANKISLCLTLPHKAGSLYHLLHKFSINRLNITKLESRPWPERKFEFLFYLDIEGNVHESQVRWLLNDLSNQLGYFKFLGNYHD